MKRKLKGWKKADRFYILNMQRGNAFTKEEDTFQMKIIKRLLSFIFLCVIIAGGVLGYKGYEVTGRTSQSVGRIQTGSI